MTSRDQFDPREQRSGARATWPVRRATLDDDGDAQLSAATSPEERIAMMTALAEEAWRLADQPLPQYDRSSAPVRRTTLADA